MGPKVKKRKKKEKKREYLNGFNAAGPQNAVLYGLKFNNYGLKFLFLLVGPLGSDMKTLSLKKIYIYYVYTLQTVSK